MFGPGGAVQPNEVEMAVLGAWRKNEPMLGIHGKELVGGAPQPNKNPPWFQTLVPAPVPPAVKLGANTLPVAAIAPETFAVGGIVLSPLLAPKS
jgi:hypothetical protein